MNKQELQKEIRRLSKLPFSVETEGTITILKMKMKLVSDKIAPVLDR